MDVEMTKNYWVATEAVAGKVTCETLSRFAKDEISYGCTRQIISKHLACLALQLQFRFTADNFLPWLHSNLPVQHQIVIA